MVAKIGQTLEGVVQSWRPDRGFGFVVDGDGDAYFVHATDISGAEIHLRPGQRVMFEVVRGIPGKHERAVSVQPLD